MTEFQLALKQEIHQDSNAWFNPHVVFTFCIHPLSSQFRVMFDLKTTGGLRTTMSVIQPAPTDCGEMSQHTTFLDKLLLFDEKTIGD